MWQTIVEGSGPDTLHLATPAVEEIEPGTPIIIRVNLSTAAIWMGTGLAAKGWGAEMWAPNLVGAHIAVEDVDGGTDYIEIKGTTLGTPAALIIVAVVVALAAVGLTAWMIRDIKISADITERQQQTEQFTTELIDRGYTPAEVNTTLGHIYDIGRTSPILSMPDVGKGIGDIGKTAAIVGIIGLAGYAYYEYSKIRRHK